MRAAGLLLAVTILAAGCALPRPQPSTPYYAEVLSAAPFTQLVVEIDHAPGVGPSESAVTHLVTTLKNVTHKRDVSVLIESTLPQDASHKWTADELRALEVQTRTTEHVAPVAVLHVLYPAGAYEKSDVAGVTIAGTVIGPVTIFRSTLAACKTPAPLPPLALPNPDQATEALERATLLHETGHALGLVANGLPMVRDHEDKEHPAHSNDQASVMYWALDTCQGLQESLLADGKAVPSTFDEDDRADLAKGGAP